LLSFTTKAAPISSTVQGGGKRRGHIAIINVTGVTATAVSQNYGPVSGVLIMPTDLDAVTRRKREAQTDQTQTTITAMSVCLIIYLGVLVLMLEVIGQHS
jgi:guanylate kinase